NRLEKLLQGVEIVDDSELPAEEPLEPEVEETPNAPIASAGSVTTDAPPIVPVTASPPVPAPGPPATAGSARHFELIDGTSRKFWEISNADDSSTLRFGRIGTSGQSQTKSFADEY